MDREVARQEQATGNLVAGDTHRAAEMYSSAIEEYEKALTGEHHLPASEQVELRLNLADCLHAVGRYEDAQENLRPLLEREGLEAADRARVCSRIGWADFFLGKIDSCRELCEEAATLLLPTNEHDDVAKTLRWLGYALRAQGDVASATECFRDALAAAKRGSDSAQLAFCLESLGNLWRVQGRYSEAISCHLESLRLHEERGSREHVGNQRLHLGLARLYLGEWTAARDDLERAFRVFDEICFERERILVSISLCRLCRRSGASEAALQYATDAYEMALATSYPRGVVLAEEELGDLAADTREFDRAATHLESALRRARSIAPTGDLVYETSWRLARVYIECGRLEEAEPLAQDALEMARASSDRRELAHALSTLGHLFFERDPEMGTEYLEDALEEFRAIRAPYEQAVVHELAARLAGDEIDSTRHLLEAKRLFGKIGAATASERVDRSLSRFREKGARKESDGARTTPAPEIITDSISDLVETAKELASIDATILMEGETGTGKEVLARIIHRSGPRHDKPFVAVNCAAFPEHLLESELFGHRKGSFTGADRDRKGILESAEGGTVLLDEIDKASPDFQAKLLRVIEEKSVRPVGSRNSIRIKARILCAANRNLLELVESRAFLPDLLYRMSGFRLRIPPLRERPSDVHILAHHFLDRCAASFGRKGLVLGAAVKAALGSYHWPGNVRELKNVIESSAFYARNDDAIELHHLPPEIREGSPDRVGPDTLPERIAGFERRQILAAMKQARGVKTQAAKILGVSRKGLNDRLRRLGLE